MTRNVQGNYRIMVHKQKDTSMYLLKMTLYLLVLLTMFVIPLNALQIHDAMKSLIMQKLIFLLTDILIIKVLCY